MRGMSIAIIADLAAAPMMLALAFGRVGCFMNGCCYGKRGEGFPCVSFPSNSPAAQDPLVGHGADGKSNPVHPTQLYETTAALAIFFILSWFYRKKRKAQGEVFLMMVMLYGTWRFLIEFARGDKRPDWGGLSYSQWVSMIAFMIAGVWMFLLRKRARQGVEPPVPPPAGEPGNKAVPPPPSVTEAA
jgi:phosphatidylglycerol:prolipoprotein diacylglycerol transferase